MYSFSNDEFNIMIEELVGKSNISYNMLCHIADKMLRPTVRYWCFADCALKGKNFEDDIMQEIQIRLIQTSISGFILRDGCDRPINNDSEGFRSWLFKVALNIKRDFSNQQRKRSFNECVFALEEEESIADVYEYPAIVSYERILLLKKAFTVVIESDVMIYKVLTWIAQFLYVLQLDKTKIESNELIIQEFEKKTLFEMRNILLNASKKLVWLEITDEQKQKIECALQTKWDAERALGQVAYSEFYMKKGAKATISDWVNRMNNLIKREIGNDTLNG